LIASWPGIAASEYSFREKSMDMESTQQGQGKGEWTSIEVRSYYVRERNALVVRAAFGPLYMDYYLHWMQHGIVLDKAVDAILKDALAALVLHMVSRPLDEVTAWTINFQEPRLNIFVTANNKPGNVVGQAWTEHVRAADEGLFCADVVRGAGDKRRSQVAFSGGDVFGAVEKFYQQSEQRRGRYFQIAPEEFVLVTAQPDCDMEWLEDLTDESVGRLDKEEELSLLEQRHYYFECGCNDERIVSRLEVLSLEEREELFGSESMFRISCPRCGAKFEVSRERFAEIMG